MNAKKEFEQLVDNIKQEVDNVELLAAEVQFGEGIWDETIYKFTLKREYTEEEYNKFLVFLNREYDDGYGGQVLFGTLWFSKNVWATRGEYDGSEWWDYHIYPPFPE